MKKQIEEKKEEKLKSFPKVYSEDIVKLKKPKKKQKDLIGSVTRVFNEDNDEDVSDEEHELQEGEVEVYWNDGESEIISEDKLEVIDRSFLHGDVVAFSHAPLEKSGWVKEVTMLCDVVLINVDSEEEIRITNVNSKHLEHIHKFGNRTMVVYDQWVAQIEETFFDLEISFDNDSKCKISKPDVDVLEGDLDNDTVPYYPGLELEFNNKKLRQMLKEAEWINGKYDSKYHSDAIGTITKVTPSDLSLNFVSDGSGLDPPESFDIKKFKTFGYYVYANWAVFDKCFVTKEIVNMTEDERKKAPKERLNIKDVDPDKNYVIEIELTKTYVDIVWQDGSEEKNVDTTKLVSLQHSGANDFWPQDYVKIKGDEKGKVGFIQKVDPKQKTCVVKWDDKEEKIEELSIYEIEDNSDFYYSLGDVVVRLPGSEKEKDFIGEVIGMKDGTLEIFWISGEITNVKYNEVLNCKNLIEELDEDDEEDDEEDGRRNEMLEMAHKLMEKLEGEASDEEEEDDSEEEKESEEDSDKEKEKEDETRENSREEQRRTQVNQFLEQLRSFIGQQEEISNKEKNERKNLFKYKSSEKPEDYIPENSEIKIEENMKELKIEEPKDEKVVETKIEESKEELKEVIKKEDQEDKLEKFEVVCDIKDHHFGNTQPQTSPQFLKIVQKEWKLLQENLPEGIYVKAYENNMNLLRAIIIGSKNTPYYDGVFVFDLLLPDEYPRVPPKLFFWSYGQRLNPNLYDNGKVCLSLLGTWEGKDDCEVWNPKKSNVLQVLLSISGLVLNSEPYYNEAGYDKQVGTQEGHHNSIQYTENVLLSMIQHHSKCMMNSPNYCEVIIKDHFEKRLKEIVGRYERLEKKDLEELGFTSTPSQGFILLLKKTILKLKKE